MVRWAGERVNVYANKIRQLAGLAGFEGAGLERFTKLAFVTGFPNAISIELQQAPNIETLAMGDLLERARVLTTGDQGQDVAAAVSSLCGGIAPAGLPYPVEADIREDYERELRTWMSNGWLVPYKEEELGTPPKG